MSLHQIICMHPEELIMFVHCTSMVLSCSYQTPLGFELEHVTPSEAHTPVLKHFHNVKGMKNKGLFSILVYSSKLANGVYTLKISLYISNYLKISKNSSDCLKNYFDCPKVILKASKIILIDLKVIQIVLKVILIASQVFQIHTFSSYLLHYKFSVFLYTILIASNVILIQSNVILIA